MSTTSVADGVPSAAGRIVWVALSTLIGASLVCCVATFHLTLVLGSPLSLGAYGAPLLVGSVSGLTVGLLTFQLRLHIYKLKAESARSRLAEEALRESEGRRLRSLELANAGTWEWEVSSNVVTWSDHVYRIFDLPLGTPVTYATVAERVHPDDREGFKRHTAEWLENRGGAPFAHRIVRSDGSIRHVHLIGEVVCDAEGEPTRAFGFLRDLTEQKQAEGQRLELEAQFQQAQKLESLGVLASGLAHDFNNLLVGIYGNMDLALLDLEPNSPVRAYVADALTAAQRAAELISQMLVYAGNAKTNLEDVDLNALVREMTDLLKCSVTKKTKVRFELAEDLPPTHGDPTQIRQIVMNLITNAAQAIGEHAGEITLKTELVRCDRAFLSEFQSDQDLAEGTYLSLLVSDSGCGLDEETRKRIFDPFFTTKATGSGLGLSAVHGIVRSHRGAIKIESEQGKGTSFTILFPAVLPPIETNTDTAPPTEELRGSGTILVVDDEPMVRTLTARAVESFGFRALTAPDGAKAVEVFREHQDTIDCVLLDSRMPGMDGEETFQELSRIRSEVPVILCSGFTGEDSMEALEGKGLAGFLPKPYKFTTLKEKLGEVLHLTS